MNNLNNILFIILLTYETRVLLAATSCANPLTSTLGLTGPTTAAVVPDLKVCKSLKNTESCCDAESFNSIQSKTDTLLASLRETVATRDIALTNIRLRVLPGVVDNVQKLAKATKQLESAAGSVGSGAMNLENLFTESAAASPSIILPPISFPVPAVPAPLTPNSSSGGASAAPETSTGTSTSGGEAPVAAPAKPIEIVKPSGVGAAKAAASTAVDYSQAAEQTTTTTPDSATMIAYVQKIKDLSDQLPKLKENFISYQKNRTNCIIQMARLQAAALCLACDPNYASKGVASDGSVTLSSTLETKLSNACYDYFAGTEEQSRLAEVQQLAPVMSDFASAVEMFAQNDTTTAKTTIKNVATQIGKIPPPTRNAEKPIAKPLSCTKSDCSVLWSKVFSKGQVNVTVLGNGGVFDDDSSSSGGSNEKRILMEEGRLLQNWEFDDDEAGVTVTFEDDPGNANNMTASGSLLGRAIMILLCSLFMTMIL